MNTWQETLDLIVNYHGKHFFIHSKEKNEFTLIEYFVNNVNIRKQILKWFGDLENSNEIYKKDPKKSEEFRTKGNIEFRNKNYLLSVKYYTLSLQLAPSDSENISLAFANRSAALFYLEKFENSIKDINAALKNNYPTSSVHKLNLRAAHCYSRLHKKELMDQELNELRKNIENNSSISKTQKESIQEQIMKLSFEYLNFKENTIVKKNNNFKLPDLLIGPNPNFSYASAALDLEYSNNKGRYVVANRNISKGQVLFAEKPVAFVLLNNYHPDFICANCCRPEKLVAIPCKFCTDTVYCSQKCKSEAWSTYHQWECFGNQIGLWKQIGIAHLAMRTFLNCFYLQDKCRLNETLGLVTNIDKLVSNDLFVYGITAYMMALYLKKFTNFFNKMNIYDQLFSKFENEIKLKMNTSKYLSEGKWTDHVNLLFSGGIILRNMLQLICNAHTIEYSHSNQNQIATDSQKINEECENQIASAIYPSASMMNHSCKPNITNSFKGQYLIVKAAENISAKDEVYNCYGPHFKKMTTAERQHLLQNQYGFICECEACCS